MVRTDPVIEDGAWWAVEDILLVDGVVPDVSAAVEHSTVVHVRKVA
jgi:hypothetical protein